MRTVQVPGDKARKLLQASDEISRRMEDDLFEARMQRMQRMQELLSRRGKSLEVLLDGGAPAS